MNLLVISLWNFPKTFVKDNLTETELKKTFRKSLDFFQAYPVN
ncbi:hypothetical protein SK137_1781 [Streptococcus mitis]|nr:hypothetical protein SK137_1781 [Streptococcus mitis]